MTVVRDFRLVTGFDGDTLSTVPYADALHRVEAFCTARGSGWLTYDLAGIQARTSGVFDVVAVWSLLWADALAGQLAVQDIAGFNVSDVRISPKRSQISLSGLALAIWTPKDSPR